MNEVEKNENKKIEGKSSVKIKNGCLMTLKNHSLVCCCAVLQKKSCFTSKNTTNVCQWTNSIQQLVFESFCVGERRREASKTEKNLLLEDKEEKKTFSFDYAVLCVIEKEIFFRG